MRKLQNDKLQQSNYNVESLKQYYHQENINYTLHAAFKTSELRLQNINVVKDQTRKEELFPKKFTPSNY